MIVTVFRYSGGKLLRQLVSKKFCTQRKVITICNFLMRITWCVCYYSRMPLLASFLHQRPHLITF
jgi:hypothetical protein